MTSNKKHKKIAEIEADSLIKKYICTYVSVLSCIFVHSISWSLTKPNSILWIYSKLVQDLVQFVHAINIGISFEGTGNWISLSLKRPSWPRGTSHKTNCCTGRRKNILFNHPPFFHATLTRRKASLY